jgi:hypothetical protein
MDFVSSTVFSRAVNGVVEGIFAADVVLSPVSGTALNGMTSIGFDCSFYFTSLSSSASIFFNCAFCSMVNLSISSFSPSISAISFVYAYSISGSFNCFLIDAISTFFFLIISSISFTIEGSYPILRTNSSNVLILLSFTKDNIFSNFSCVWTLLRDSYNLVVTIEAVANVEKTISPVFLCRSI